MHATFVNSLKQQNQERLDFNALQIAATRAVNDMLKLPVEKWTQVNRIPIAFEATLDRKTLTLTYGLDAKPEVLTIREPNKTTNIPVEIANSPNILLTQCCTRLHQSLSTAINKQKQMAAEELANPDRIKDLATAGPNRKVSLSDHGTMYQSRVYMKDPVGLPLTFDIQASKMPYTSYGKSGIAYHVEVKTSSQFGGLYSVELREKTAKAIFNGMEALSNSAKRN